MPAAWQQGWGEKETERLQEQEVDLYGHYSQTFPVPI